MLIFLPNQMEDSTTGLEKVGRSNNVLDTKVKRNAYMIHVHSQLEKLLTYDNFMNWTCPDMMDVVEVQVGLPRFKMEEKCNMKNILVSMGMVDAFDVAASDFSGRSLSPNSVLRRAETILM